MSNAGIDYGNGKFNVDTTTGIRFGVISQHSIMPEALDDMESDYGTPHCPECGNDVCAPNDGDPEDSEEWANYSKYGCNDYVCLTCEHYLDSADVFSDESIGFSYEADGYKLYDCLDSDIFIQRSPFYTLAQFCSPCVPGAGNIDNPLPDGIKTYCLGHDWFEESIAPYPVYSVIDDSIVSAE